MTVPRTPEELFGRFDYAAMRAADRYASAAFPQEWPHYRPAVARIVSQLSPGVSGLSGEMPDDPLSMAMLGAASWLAILKDPRSIAQEARSTFNAGPYAAVGFVAVPALALWLGSMLLKGGRR